MAEAGVSFEASYKFSRRPHRADSMGTRRTYSDLEKLKDAGFQSNLARILPD
jgi:hypothetical protein